MAAVTTTPRRRSALAPRLALFCWAGVLLLGPQAVALGAGPGHPARTAPPLARMAAAEELPATVAPARAVELPESLGPEGIDPTWAFQFGWGLHNLTVDAPELGVELQPRSVTKDGVSVSLDLLLGPFRVGYVRQFFRREPSEEILLEGDRVTLLGYESDQLWVFHGFRPVRRFYLGYGLGWQRREITVRRETVTETGTEAAPTLAFTESLAMAAVMVDWLFAPPFSLQVRSVREESGKFFQAAGETLLLAYVVPF